MNLFKINCMLLIVVQSFVGYGQQIPVDSLKQLNIVEVSASRLTVFSNSNKTEHFDSTFLSRYSINNLADILTNESQVFVKSYGLGSLATTSFRGSGANHTALLWNGFNLQSPMNGLVDMSLIPINFMSDIKIQYGGAGALWGTGAVGGSIHLNNSSEYNRGITVATTTSFGSFSDKQQQANVEISKKRFITSIKVFNHDAKNDFPFINSTQYGKPEQKQSNAELKEYGFLQENYFLINDKQKLSTHFWYQNNDRNIPPSMTQNINVANQKDEFYRATADWQRTTEKLTIIARAAYFDEYLFFVDTLVDIDSKSRTKVFIAEAESRFSLTKYDLLNIGVNNTYSEAESESFLIIQHQNRTAIFGNYKIQSLKKQLSAVISGRQEFVEGKSVPFSGSIALEAKFLKCFILRGNAAQHYRLPTFNDLFYKGEGGLGVADLKPETGWSEELSLINKYSIGLFSWELGATAFNRDINNWIIWQPVSSSIWSPKNLMKVWSRGIEYKVNIGIKKNKFNFQVSGLYNYVLSTNEKSALPNDETLGKQLMYVPIQNAQGNATITYKGTSLSYTQVYIGYRYTLSDNSDFLKPYTVGNISLAQTFSLENSKLKLFAQLNNIWQETYQVMEYRAMPLFNYQVGLSLLFNQPNKKNNFK